MMGQQVTWGAVGQWGRSLHPVAGGKPHNPASLAFHLTNTKDVSLYSPNRLGIFTTTTFPILLPSLPPREPPVALAQGAP